VKSLVRVVGGVFGVNNMSSSGIRLNPAFGRYFDTWREHFKREKIDLSITTPPLSKESTLNTCCDVSLARFHFRGINHSGNELTDEKLVVRKSRHIFTESAFELDKY
jgi:hypothetical protein